MSRTTSTRPAAGIKGVLRVPITALRSASPVLENLANPSRTVPSKVTRSTPKQALTEPVEFDDRRHSRVITSGWPGVADACPRWLREQGL